ncbi:hypothetical protein [Flammeovirga sp. SubArs3]|uniref:hypothetical protein n=1 Tax=Flammeovirga sp. SubArs3 TaxID=2995316 RepID=UPI00248C8107|nr:hypothetical protein [Flammeovirga sp. SubArs3]
MLKRIFILIILFSCSNPKEEEKFIYDHVDFISFDEQELIPTIVVDSLDKTIDLYKIILSAMKKSETVAVNNLLRVNYNDKIYYLNNKNNFCYLTQICCPRSSDTYSLDDFNYTILNDIISHFNSVPISMMYRKSIEIHFNIDTNINETLWLLKLIEMEFSIGKLKGYPYNLELVPKDMTRKNFDLCIPKYEFHHDTLGLREYSRRINIEKETSNQVIEERKRKYEEELLDIDLNN